MAHHSHIPAAAAQPQLFIGLPSSQVIHSSHNATIAVITAIANKAGAYNAISGEGEAPGQWLEKIKKPLSF
jgi:hypothetical protein